MRRRSDFRIGNSYRENGMETLGVGPHGEHPQSGPDVTVKVDKQDKEVHRGSWVVSGFKAEVGVDAAKQLDEFVNGEMVELKDDQRIVIKGGEQFFSHARVGKSS